MSPTRDTIGLLARSIDVIAALDAVCAGDGEEEAMAAAGDARPVAALRLGVPRHPFYADLDPELAAVVEAALGTLAGAGAQLVEIDLEDVRVHNEACAMEIVLYEAIRELALFVGARPSLGIGLRDLLAGMRGEAERAALEGQLGAGAVTAERYRRALVVERPRLQDAFARAFSGHGLDALVLPTTPAPAPPVAASEWMAHAGRDVPTFATLIRNTDASSNAGLPCVSAPAGEVPSGLPVGLELVGPAGLDRRLLEVARTVFGAL